MKLSSTAPLESFTVCIYDTNSKVIYTDLFYCPDSSFIKQVNLNNHADGIYIVSIYNNTDRISRKIILKK
ncbi:T9SS type A sorting domain-containing protein [Plebeiibacterium sediminum]|uniref:T9SS type A sorting domain-containing protein n=1 Tax=Plebeiibacterium sediminum TaxID=2992112 RepID=UPI00343CD75E